MNGFVKFLVCFLSAFSFLFLPSCDKEEVIEEDIIPPIEEKFEITDLVGKRFSAEQNFSITYLYRYVNSEGYLSTETRTVELSDQQYVVFSKISASGESGVLKMGGKPISVQASDGSDVLLPVISPILGQEVIEFNINIKKTDDVELWTFRGSKLLSDGTIVCVNGIIKPNENPQIEVEYQTKDPVADNLISRSKIEWSSKFNSDESVTGEYASPQSPFVVDFVVDNWEEFQVPFTPTEFLQAMFNFDALRQADYGFGASNLGIASLAKLYHMVGLFMFPGRMWGDIKVYYWYNEVGRRQEILIPWNDIDLFSTFTIHFSHLNDKSFLMYVNPAEVLNTKVLMRIGGTYDKNDWWIPKYEYYPMDTAEVKELVTDLLIALGDKMSYGIPINYDIYSSNRNFLVLNFNDKAIAKNLLLSLVKVYTRHSENRQRLEEAFASDSRFSSYMSQIVNILDNLETMFQNEKCDVSFGLKYSEGWRDFDYSDVYTDAWGLPINVTK